MDVSLLNTDGSILILCEAIDHTPWVFHSRPDDRPRPVSTLAAPVPAEDKDLILILKQEVRLGPCLKLVPVVQRIPLGLLDPLLPCVMPSRKGLHLLRSTSCQYLLLRRSWLQGVRRPD